MRVILNFIAILIALSFFSTLAIADLQVSVDKQIYNLDDSIGINASIIENKTLNSFLKMELKCSNLAFQFYFVPVSIEQNKEKQLATSIPATEQMLGECSVYASLTDFGNNVIDSKSSDKFNITDKLFGYFRIDKEVYKPSEEIVIGGYIKKASGEGYKGKLDIYFDGKLIKTIDVDNNFEYNQKIEDSTKGGKHFIKVATSDKNKAEHEFAIFLESEARKLALDVKEKSYLPGEAVKAGISLKDQAGEDIRQDVSIDLIAPNNNWLGSWRTDSSTIFEYRLDKFAVPGIYTLSATFNALVAEASFNVSELKKLDFDIQNNTIVIENSGNVVYDDTIEIYLESQKKRYLIAKKIKLMPGEKTLIELYKEVPDDSYNVTVPSLKESKANNESIKVTGMIVKDERTIIQKSGDAINEITGAFLGHKVVYSLSFFIMGILLLLIVILHIRKLRKKSKRSDNEIKKEAKRKEINTMLLDFIKK